MLYTTRCPLVVVCPSIYIYLNFDSRLRLFALHTLGIVEIDI